MDLEIRERIASYVAGTIEAAALEDWLADVAWDLTEEPSSTHVATAMRLLAERGNGDWTDEELRDHLGALNRSYWFDVAPKETWTGSDAHVIQCQIPPSEGVGTQRVAASV